MYIEPAVKRRIWIGLAVLPLLLPGWRGELVPVPHDTILLESGRHEAGEVFGVSLDGDVPGEEWHAQYVASGPAQFLDLLNLRALAPRIVPPAFVAHIPPGRDALPQRADAYFRVETSWRWPWWWPGGGVPWELPSR